MMEESKKKKRLLVAMVIFLSFFGSYELIGQEEVGDEEDLEEVFDEAVNESAEEVIEDFEDGGIEEDEEENENEGVEKVIVEDRKIKIGSEVDSRTVITREEIEKSGSKNVPELLQKQPGVYVQPPASGAWPGSGASAIRMRGRVSTQTLVLIDGIPTNQDWNGNAVSLNGIPLQGIERIEILRGNQAALYGSGSFGGVINIITRKGSKSQKETKLLGHGYGGSSKKLDLGFGLINRSKDHSVSFYMNYLGRQAIQYPTKDGDKEIKQTKEIDNYKNINALANVYMVLNESATASITANHKASELNYGDNKRSNTAKNISTLLGTSIQYALNELYKPELQLSYRTYSHKSYRSYNTIIDRFDAKLLNHFDLLEGTNRLTLGFEYNLYKMSYFANRSDSRYSSEENKERAKKIKSVIDNPSPLITQVQKSFEKNRNAKSIILSDLWTPLEGLTIDLTGKVHFLSSNYGLSDEGMNFKAGVGYSLVDNPISNISLIKLRTAASYGHYTLIHAQHYVYHSREDYDGNELRPEEGFSWEAGMDTSFLQDQVGFSGTFYMYNIKDKILYVPYTFPSGYRYRKPVNVDKAKSSGFELELRTEIPLGFTLKANYNYTKTDYYKKQDQEYRNEEYKDPRDRVNINLNWNYFEPFNLGFNWRLESESYRYRVHQRTKEDVKIKGYNVLDINASLSIIEQLQVVGGLYNVLNTVYKSSQTGSYGQKMNFFAGIQFNLDI